MSWRNKNIRRIDETNSWNNVTQKQQSNLEQQHEPLVRFSFDTTPELMPKNSWTALEDPINEELLGNDSCIDQYANRNPSTFSLDQYSTKLPTHVSAELREHALRVEKEIGAGRDEG